MQWRDVKGYEGLYQVSDSGQVRSTGRETAGGRRIKGRDLKESQSSWGVRQVSLTDRFGIAVKHNVKTLKIVAFPETESGK